MKHLFTFLLLISAYVCHGAEPLTLVLQTNDNSIHTIDAANLKMTIADGNLIVGDKSFVLTDLVKMYFSGEVTAMSEIETSIVDGKIDIYTTSGIHVGSFNNIKDARAALSKGIYIISNGVKSFKTAIE